MTSKTKTMTSKTKTMTSKTKNTTQYVLDTTKHKTQDDDKQNKKHNTIGVGHHSTQANTNNINKTWAFLQTTGGKDETNIVCMRKSLQSNHLLKPMHFLYVDWSRRKCGSHGSRYRR